MPDGWDTGSDLNLVKRSSTLGAPNGDYCSLAAGDVVINEVVGSPRTDWNRSAGGGLPFDGGAGSGDVTADDEYVELLNTSGGVLDLEGCVVDMDDGTPESWYLTAEDPTPTPFVRVFDAAGVLVGTGGQITAVPAAGYVLLGDPPGSITILSTIRVRSGIVGSPGQPVDEVSFGDDAPSLSSTNLGDEATGRFPNGVAAGDGVAALGGR